LIGTPNPINRPSLKEFQVKKLIDATSKDHAVMSEKPVRDTVRQSRPTFIRRHSLVTRLTHWINALCLSFLLLSGLQIFNAHPELYWGHYGADGDPAVLTIGSERREGDAHGFLRVAGMELRTTGVLGISRVQGELSARAFPAWATSPSFQDLAAGRRWHFFFAWLFLVNGILYFTFSVLNGHFRRDLAPTSQQLSPRHLWHEILDHARLRFPEGEEAKHYNALQKLTYLAVIFVLLRLMIVTGLTMSPGVNAALPALVDLFGGRQSARTIHFITASLLVLFVIVHVAMVILSGAWNNIRSMITGRYAIHEKGPKS
jgi:thiosulfate reductase cytochrome b subunit